MNVYLDANIIILSLTPHPSLRDKGKACRTWLLKLKGSEHSVFVPSIAYHEVHRAYLAMDGRTGGTKVKQLNAFLQAFGMSRLAITQRVVDHASTLWAHLEITGMRVSDRTFDGDVMIASEVMQHNTAGAKVLTTENVRHSFQAYARHSSQHVARHCHIDDHSRSLMLSEHMLLC